MQVLDPNILMEARGISVALCASGVALGLMLWLTGWMYHRFWIVLATTVVAGLFGLLSSPNYRVQPLVAGLLLAVAAGVMALALVRVVAFIAGGIAAWLLVHTALPPSLHEPMVCFMAGGLAGLLLFRTWTKVLTSFAGTLLMGYSGLCLADRLGKLDAIRLTEQKSTLLNIGCAAMTLVGLGIQVFLDRRAAKKKQKTDEMTQQQAEDKLKQFYARQMSKKKWWQVLSRGKSRKAG